jgi:hypothetical protein
MDYEEKSLNDATPFFVSGAAKHHMNIVNGIKNVPKELVNSLISRATYKYMASVIDSNLLLRNKDQVFFLVSPDII